jgi:hypothetical protein
MGVAKMPKFTIHAPAYKNQIGKIIHPQMYVDADNKFKYYTAYPYFAGCLSETASSTIEDGFKKSTADELLARARRLIVFSDFTCLKPVQFKEKMFRKLVDRLYAAGPFDHLSYWISTSGTKFIISESYRFKHDVELNLAEQGLIATLIPTSLSPYCGGWSSTSGVKPGTTSYLICDHKSLAELTGLKTCLRNSIYLHSRDNSCITPTPIPAWNCVKGINHV